MRQVIFPVIMVAGLVSSGCIATAVGAGGTPPETFDLNAETAIGDVSAPSGVQLLVTEPSTLQVLATQQVAVRVSDRAIQYLGGARLADSLTRLTQFKLKRSLEGAPGIGSVGLPGEGLAIDYQVLTDIRAFEIRTTAAEEAFVSLAVRLLDDRSGNVIASRLFNASVPVAGGGAGEVDNEQYLSALDAALDAALVQIRAWAVSSTSVS